MFTCQYNGPRDMSPTISDVLPRVSPAADIKWATGTRGEHHRLFSPETLESKTTGNKSIVHTTSRVFLALIVTQFLASAITLHLDFEPSYNYSSTKVGSPNVQYCFRQSYM